MHDDLVPSALFVFGFARSGTTVLQNALNAHPDIFLFGEPDFHRDTGGPDFAARYNAMHRAWANQETKSTFCPPWLAADAPWQAHLRRAAALHRFVGAKTVINPSDGAAGIDALFGFQCRHFYRAHNVFTFRNPGDVIASIHGLAAVQGVTPVPSPRILEMFVRTVALYLRMLRTMPHVAAVFHEATGDDIVDSLEQFLDTPLPHARAYYQPARTRRHGAPPPDATAHLPLVAEFYEDFRRETEAGLPTLQLEQNTAHLDPAHLTALGRFVWRADRIATHLTAF